MRVFNIEVQKEKELIFWLVDDRISARIARHLYNELELSGEGGGVVFMMPADAMGLSPKALAENLE